VEQTTEALAQFIDRTTLEAIPREVIDLGKLHVLDTLGTLFAGSGEKIAAVVKEYVQRLGCKPESTLVTQGVRTSPPYAAFGNGTIAHVLDFDDYEWPSQAHPSVTVLPAALALGEKTQATGKTCLEAYLVGLEVISKIGTGVNPSHYGKGWHSTGTLGTLGAAGASVKILNCDLETIKTALGIASSMSSGLRGNFGTMTKALHAGHASKNGVEAATLASLGFTADKTILERRLGFCSVFTEGESYNLQKIVQNLGNPFSLLSPGVGIKPYPSPAATHAVLDGVLQLVKQHGIKADDVEGVECGIFYLYPTMLIHSDPRTGLEGKFSMEFCVAVALLDREITPEKFTDEKVNHPEIRTLMKKVRTYVTKEVGKKGTLYPGALVKIILRNGTSYSVHIKNRKGGPSNPLSKDEVVKKFVGNASLVLKRNDIDEITEKVLQLEDLSDIRDLIQCLNR
jgi:2-methylcitrate dehydratase PrpD